MRSAYKILSLLLILSLAVGCDKDDDDVGCGDSQLENVNWEVQHLEDNDAIITPPEAYIVQFTPREYSIRLDVNICRGNYKACNSDQLIDLQGAACTEVCCDTMPAEIILAFLANEVIRYEIDGDTLRLIGHSTLDKRLILVKR